MSELFKYSIFVFLGLRLLIDLGLSAATYYQFKTLAPGIGFMALCSVFYLFLYFGIKNEEFRGRYGHRVYSSEPFAYWFIVAFLVLSHLAVTILMASLIHW